VLESCLANLGIALDDIATVTATHLHPDHMGLASWLAARNAIPVNLHAFDLADLESGDADARYSDDLVQMGNRWGVPHRERYRLQQIGAVAPFVSVVAATPIRDGDLLPIPGRTARVVHTPGHTRGHSCLEFTEEQVLLSGDHLLPKTFPGIGLGGHHPGGSNPVADYLRSLHRLVQFDDYDVAPGHEFQFRGLRQRRHDIMQHVLKRARNTASSLASNPEASVWSIALTLTWRGGLGALRGHQLQSALRQADMYADLVRVGGLEKWA
jgi:glyoxylase-like metal-dependent hydrolase (beta-lactamase superfamily II)